MAHEKRKEHRLKVHIPIQLRFGPHTEVETRTMNLSRLGTYVEVDHDAAAGKTVSLVMALPKYSSDDSSLSGDVKCRGTVFRNAVVREQDGKPVYGLGIFFTDFSTFQDKEKLSKYVDYLVEKEEQDIREGVRRRKEKEEHDNLAKHGEDREAFQKEVLSVLKTMASRIEEIHKVVTSQSKGK